MEQLLNKPFVAVLLSLFFVMTGYGVLLPVLPFFTERLLLKNESYFQNAAFHVAILTAIYPLAQLLTAVFWGKLSDSIGRRPVILLGLAGYVLMQVLTGMATTLPMLYAIRVAGALVSSFSIPVISAYISDITTQHNRKQGMAWSGAAISAGVVAGPALAGVLMFEDFHFSTSFGHFRIDRYSVPFMVLGAAGILILILAGLWLQRPAEKIQQVLAKVPKSSVWSLLSKEFVILLVVSLSVQWVLTLFETTFSVYGQNELKLTPALLSTGFVVCGLVMGAAQPLIASQKGKYLSIHKQLSAGFMVVSASFFVFPWFASLTSIFFIIAVLSVGFALIIPNLLTVASFIQPASVGLHLGVLFSANAVGQILGPVTGLLIYDLNAQAPFLVAGLIAGMVLLLWRFPK